MVWLSVDAILRQSNPFTKAVAKRRTIIDITLPDDNSIWLGQHFLLVGKDECTALKDWLDKQSVWDKAYPRIGSIKIEHRELFKAPKCWLACLIASRSGNP